MKNVPLGRRTAVIVGFTLLLVLLGTLYLFRIVPTAVPDVRGLSEEQAWRRLSASGLITVDTSYSSEATGSVGRIVEQAPDSGSIVLRRTTVKLVVSGDPPSE